MTSIQEWLQFISQTDAFEGVLRYLITLLGSFCMYLFSFGKGFEGSIVMLKRLMPERQQRFYDRLDFFLVILVGSIIGTVFFAPKDSLQALAAGFGWVGAVNVLLKERKGSD